MSSPDDSLERRRLDRALATIAADDREAAEHARGAIDWLTAGEGLELLDQRGLQEFLWYRLPTRWLVTPDQHHAVADALGRLLAELGLDRYAAICTSPTTHEVLDAYDADPDDGSATFRRATDASGVEPVDTDHFAWGEVMGLTEAAADTTVARRLEDAIATGRLTPGGRGWARARADLIDATLDEPVPDHPATTWRAAIAAERLDTWLTAANPARAEVLGAVAERIALPPDPPTDLDAVIGPVRELLAAADDGLPLTGTHRLKPAFVTELADRFGWWAPGTRRQEEDVTEVWRTRELAETLRAVRRRGDRLLLTRRGRQLLADPGALWRAITGTLVPDGAFAGSCAQLGLAVLLEATSTSEGHLDEAELFRRVQTVLVAEGWRDAETGEPVPPTAVRQLLWGWSSQLETVGVLARHHDRRRDLHRAEVWLTDAGRPTARLALHLAATGPRAHPTRG